jgi:predicted ATP-binding protein involved in virulence
MADKLTTPPPAYFLSMSLENVRSFGEKQTISFARADGRPAQWTIILGDNGVGKTTVLKSLASSAPLGEFKEDSYQPQDFKNNLFLFKWNALRHGKATRGVVKSNIRVNLTLTDDNLLDYSEEGEVALEILNANPRHRNSALGISSIDLNLTGLICYGYGAGRTTGNSVLSEVPKMIDDCASLFDDRADLLNPEEWFLQMDYSSLKKDRQAAKSLREVRRILLQVLPDVIDVRINSTGHQQYLELRTPYGWVRLRDMSLGYQTLVVWLTDFASKLLIRYPNSPKPLEMPAIVLIDEIDLHLHPSWQRKLIGFLSGIFKNTQFIATAHSPLVVQAAGDVDANVVLLRREGDQTVVVTDVADVRGWRLDQILTSELFGLETARSPATERKLARRAELLTKAKRTAAEKKELAALTQELDAEPVGETPSEREVDAVLQELRQRLLNKDASSAAA